MDIDLGYKILKRDHTYDLTKLQLHLFENLEAIRKEKSASCKFGSLLVCIFFYVQNTFPTFGIVSWKTIKSTALQISEFIEELGDNFDSVMKIYLEDFKKPMKQRLRILISLMEKYYDDICFLVDFDHTLIRVIWYRILTKFI